MPSPVLTAVWVAQRIEITITFSQPMDMDSSPSYEDFTLYSPDFEGSNPDSADGWSDSTHYVISISLETEPQTPLTVNYTKGDCPFVVLATLEEYPSLTGLPVAF